MENTRIINSIDRLTELNGCDLEWWGMVAGHQEGFCRATGAFHGYYLLHFAIIKALELVPRMHTVTMRMATLQETEELYTRANEMIHLEDIISERNGKDDILILDCSEGSFFVWAHYLKVAWSDEPNMGLERYLDPKGRPWYDCGEPLWKGGPPRSEL